jgi:hypothetical protein
VLGFEAVQVQKLQRQQTQRLRGEATARNCGSGKTDTHMPCKVSSCYKSVLEVSIRAKVETQRITIVALQDGTERGTHLDHSATIIAHSANSGSIGELAEKLERLESQYKSTYCTISMSSRSSE